MELSDEDKPRPGSACYSHKVRSVKYRTLESDQIVALKDPSEEDIPDSLETIENYKSVFGNPEKLNVSHMELSDEDTPRPSSARFSHKDRSITNTEIDSFQVDIPDNLGTIENYKSDFNNPEKLNLPQTNQCHTQDNTLLVCPEKSRIDPELKSNETLTTAEKNPKLLGRLTTDNNDRSSISSSGSNDKSRKTQRELTPVESQLNFHSNLGMDLGKLTNENLSIHLHINEDYTGALGKTTLQNYVKGKHHVSISYHITKFVIPKTENPLALLCVVGGKDEYMPTETIKQRLKNSLAEIIKTTDIWICIDNNNTGVVTIVKEVIRKNVGKRKCRVFYKDLKYTLTSPQKDNVDGMKQFNWPTPNNLEWWVKEQLKIPIIPIIIGGEVDSLTIALNYVQKNVHVVAIGGSGGVADFISTGYRMSMQTKCEAKTIFQETFESEMIEAARCIRSPSDTQKTDTPAQKLTSLLQKGLKENRKYIHVISINETVTTLDKKIQDLIFQSLYHGQGDNEIIKYKNTITHYADLWNRPDIAKKGVFNLENRKELHKFMGTLGKPGSNLAQLFQNSLVQNRVECVRLVLEYTQKNTLYKRFLDNHLEKLYTDTGCRAGFLIEQQKSDSRRNIVQKINIAVSLILENTAMKPFKKVEAKNGIQEDSVFKHLFIWAVLMNRKELAMLFWNKEEADYIFSALYASSLAKKLAQSASEESYIDEQAALVENSSYYEELAYSVMTQLYLKEKKQARQLLVTQVERYNCITIFEITEKFALMKFMGHAACQTQLNKIWNGRISNNTSNLKVIAAAFIPILIMQIVSIDSADEKKKQAKLVSKGRDGEMTMPVGIPIRKWPKWMSKIYFFYHSPSIKFLFSVVTYMAMLVVFSLFILTDLYPINEKSPSIKEYVIYTWAASTLTEEMRQALMIKQISLSLMTWFSFWTLFEIVMYSMLTASVFLRLILPAEIFYHARMTYAITLGLFIINSMQFFLVSKHIGPKVIMIGRMMFDILFFLLIFAVFLFGFGVIYQSTMYPNSTPSFQLFKEIMYMPYWQLYGELFLDKFEGQEPSTCTKDVTLYQNGTTDRCPEINQMNTVVLGVYMVVTHIILVNILIAMFSHTFTTVQDNNEQVWKFHRFSLVREYYDRSSLIPPLIIISHLKRAFLSILSTCSCEYKKQNKFKIENNAIEKLAILEGSAVSKYHTINRETESSGLNTSSEQETALSFEHQLNSLLSKVDSLEQWVVRDKRKIKNSQVPLTIKQYVLPKKLENE